MQREEFYDDYDLDEYYREEVSYTPRQMSLIAGTAKNVRANEVTKLITKAVQQGDLDTANLIEVRYNWTDEPYTERQRSIINGTAESVTKDEVESLLARCSLYSDEASKNAIWDHYEEVITGVPKNRPLSAGECLRVLERLDMEKGRPSIYWYLEEYF